MDYEPTCALHRRNLEKSCCGDLLGRVVLVATDPDFVKIDPADDDSIESANSIRVRGMFYEPICALHRRNIEISFSALFRCEVQCRKDPNTAMLRSTQQMMTRSNQPIPSVYAVWTMSL